MQHNKLTPNNMMSRQYDDLVLTANVKAERVGSKDVLDATSALMSVAATERLTVGEILMSGQYRKGTLLPVSSGVYTFELDNVVRESLLVSGDRLTVRSIAHDSDAAVIRLAGTVLTAASEPYQLQRIASLVSRVSRQGHVGPRQRTLSIVGQNVVEDFCSSLQTFDTKRGSMVAEAITDLVVEYGPKLIED